MNKFLISAAACALIANSALAQPVTMTDAQLDGVTADQNNNGNGIHRQQQATATATATSDLPIGSDRPRDGRVPA